MLLCRETAQFSDGVLNGASGAGGAHVQRTVHSLQNAVGTMQGKVNSLHPSLAQGTRRAIQNIFNGVRKHVDGLDRVCTSFI